MTDHKTNCKYDVLAERIRQLDALENQGHNVTIQRQAAIQEVVDLYRDQLVIIRQTEERTA